MIVLDSSAALEIAKNTQKGRAFRQLMIAEEKIISPALYQVEVANAAWKHVHAGVLGKETAQQLLEDALALPDSFIPTEDLIVEAYSEGALLDHSVYDMVYLVLARRQGATLFTCDRGLAQCCESRGIDHVHELTF